MNTQSNFVGVFTLKTQEEVAQLANAVHRLVQRSVEIFHLISTGKAHEIREYMDTINSVAPSFVDLTLDENEKNRAVAILNALSQAQSSLNPYLGYQSLNVDEGVRETVKVNMAQFLEKVADLCDLMEENQTNRGVQTVQQALRYVEILSGERPASEIFIPKVTNATNSCGPVNHLLENRISVTEEGELRETLRQLRDRLRSLGNDLTSTCKSLHQEPKNEGLGAKYKGIVVELVELLNKVLKMVQGNEVKIKGNSAFSNEHLNSALSALGDAVRSHDKDLAAENARNLVKEVQNADSPALKAKTKEVVQATIDALGDDDKQSELDKAMAELKALAAAVECGGTPGGSTVGHSGLRLALLNASKDLSHKVEDVFSPRSERFNHLN